MKNYVQPGHVVTLTAPTGGVLAGRGFVQGAIFGVALSDAAEGASVEAAIDGVVDIVKAGSQAWDIGDIVYWDSAGGEATTEFDAGYVLIGVAVRSVASGAGDTIGRVRLNGTFGVVSQDYVDAGDA